MLNIIKRIYKKTKSLFVNFLNPWWRAKRRYIKFYERLSVDPYSILVESQHGKEANGNVFYILRYLSQNEKYKDFKIFLSARQGKVKSFQEMLANYDIRNVNIIELSSVKYFETLASAKYLINDNTFLPFFMKKEGQVYLNTWHGTPLKSLGRKIKNDAHAIGNTQKNFVTADYLLFPNMHTKNAIIQDYMIANISDGTCIMAGYPRNEAFFDLARKEKIKEKLELHSERIYAYMPTFRGTAKAGGTSKNAHYLNYYLYELDKMLGDDEILYLNLHPVAKKEVNFTQFTHIRNFPADYETYDFLNVADVLVTDYSSVFFDYACTGRKIVLFTYDKEEYLRDRGMYMALEELPFPQVTNLEELLRELRSEKQYDDREFLSRFCMYENAFASQKLCDYVILGENTKLEVEKIPNNGKENVLLYAGNLAGNGITTSLRNLLNSVDLTKRNYYFSFYTEKVQMYKDAIFTFPEQACYFAMTGDANLTVWDLIVRKAFRKKWLSANAYMKLQGNRVKQNLKRCFAGASFHKIVQFNGYEDDIILGFSTFDGPRTIYVHSNMQSEIKIKGNQRSDVLRYAYNCYDNVAVVTADMIPSTTAISQKRANIKVAKNLIDYCTIQKKGKAEISLDPSSKATISEDKLRNVLNSGSECFINVGRFAPEKGQERLVSAFKTYHQKHPDSYLIIMGGYSLYDGYSKLCNLVETLGLNNHIILLEKISNPYPIIKACDYFVLSSHYEGFGLVLIEADILGLPVISTDIPGPRGFMREHGGTLVEDSEEGIYKGMELLHSGRVLPMNVDYEQYNQEAIQQFEQLLAN